MLEKRRNVIRGIAVARMLSTGRAAKWPTFIERSPAHLSGEYEGRPRPARPTTRGMRHPRGSPRALTLRTAQYGRIPFKCVRRRRTRRPWGSRMGDIGHGWRQ